MAETLEEFLARAAGSPVLVSACLLGLPTRYDGGTRRSDVLTEFARSHDVIPVCPEQLGGLATPRPKATVAGGDGAAVLRGTAKVMSESGRDVTENFLRGAKATAAIVKMRGVRFAVLKEKSPSCGVAKTYIDARLADGVGVTTAVLRSLSIEVFPVE
jgi:uncharacterized protein YbbK (DUF523 family)